MGIRAKIEEIRSQTGLSNVRLDQLRTKTFLSDLCVEGET